MKIIVAKPPNFEAIVSVFPAARKRGVIFTYGDTIYNPSGVLITQELRAHEGVHFSRQGNDVEGWWGRYLLYADFRFAEELPAHRAEYAQFRARNRSGAARTHYLRQLATRLASPLYGSLIDEPEARRLIAQ